MAFGATFPTPTSFSAGVCGTGPLAGATFAVSPCGHLYRVNNASWAVEARVVVHNGPCTCVATQGSSVVVGCADGVVRVFNGDTLAFSRSLPLPPPTNAPDTLSTPRSPMRMPVDGTPRSPALGGLPSAVALALPSQDCRRVVVMYSDHAMFVWDTDPRCGLCELCGLPLRSRQA